MDFTHGANLETTCIAPHLEHFLNSLLFIYFYRAFYRYNVYVSVLMVFTLIAFEETLREIHGEK